MCYNNKSQRWINKYDFWRNVIIGFTNLNDITKMNRSLLNSYSTSLTFLNDSNSENENVLKTLGTWLSTLYNYRLVYESALITQPSTTFSSLIHGVYPSSEIKFGTISSKSNVTTQGTGTEFLIKIDTNGKLRVYHLNQKNVGLFMIH